MRRQRVPRPTDRSDSDPAEFGYSPNGNVPLRSHHPGLNLYADPHS